VFCVVGWLVCC